MLTYLRNLQSERDTLTAAATGITETAAREERDVTDAERASIDTMSSRCAVIDDQLRTFGAQLESQRAYARLRQELDGGDDTAPRRDPAPRPVEADTRGVRSWGELFIASNEFRAYDGVGSSGRVAVPGLFTRAPIDTGGVGGLPVPPATVSVAQPSFTTPLLDAVGHVTTNSQVVQWLVDDGTYPPAQVVAEGALKPEAAFTLDMDTGTLKTYAHYKGITRQALANTPMIQSIVEGKLRGGIFAALEADIAAALAAATLTEVDGTGTGGVLGGIRSAIAEAQLAGYPNANTVLLNPADWGALDMAVFDATQDGPSRQTGFWGLRPVASAAVPVGTAYVGDLSSGVTVFDEGKAAVYMSDSHADYFIRNILVILAEVMALAMVTAPGALVRVTDTTP
jgi:HK97 family phage major capsid protein